MPLPRISIVIPVAPNREAGRVLSLIRDADYPKDRIEVFVVRGRQPSKQRNLAVKKARGEIISFLDDDSEFERGYFKRMAACFDEGYSVVGGPAISTKEGSFLQICFGYVMGSYFAMHEMRAKFKVVGKRRLTTEKELILCNMGMRRRDFLDCGGFDERLYPNEENELLNRMQEKGYRFLYEPSLVVYRKSREGLSKFARQFFIYGKSRSLHFRACPRFFKPFFLLPAIFVLYLASILFVNVLLGASIVYLFPLFAYVGLDLILSVGEGIANKAGKSSFVLLLLFPLIHISYGLGIMYGLVKRKDVTIPSEISILRLRKDEIEKYGEVKKGRG